MYSLFSTSSDKAGFRLQYMEVYNWGTFDGEIFRINPRGNNSLLTGANASGKSTFIDALLTLLVPVKNDRFYNQSSGAEKKGDRTEESYVYGHYGNIQKEGENSTTTQKLRDHTTYSVLLACFENTDGQVVTLFQLRWFSNGELKRSFGIGRVPLEIEKDFTPFDGKGNWKKRLEKLYNTGIQKKRIEFQEGPVKYAERMAQLLGMRSAKASSLFNQVVGVKVLDDLDDFIRVNMLELQDAEYEFLQLKENFMTLMDAKVNIEKAKEQIAQLIPINELAKNLEEIGQRLKTLENDKEVAVYWFTAKGTELTGLELDDLKARLAILLAEIEKLKLKEDDLKVQERDMAISIANDEVEKQIEKLAEDISKLERSRDQSKHRYDSYNALATGLGLQVNPDMQAFEQSKKLAAQKKKECDKQREAADEIMRQARNEEDQLKEQSELLINTVESLQKNKSNISGREAEIRDEILAHIGAAPEEIPFIGELVRVREEDSDWELAIEKVLHNFALRMVVPEKYYRQVNAYVNNTNLRGRITYQRFQGYTSLGSLRRRGNDDDLLVNKLEFRTDSKYAEWLEDTIAGQFDYTCADSLESFNHFTEKALTREGLIKGVKGKHEKDDRAHVSKRENFVLGWDNKEKISLLKKELSLLHLQQDAKKQNLKNQAENLKQVDLTKERLATFLTAFTSFDDLNWSVFAKEIQEKQSLKQSLEKTNDKNRVLKDQLKAVRLNLTTNGIELEAKNKQKYRQEDRLEELQQELDRYRETLGIFRDKQVDLNAFEAAHPDLKDIDYASFIKANDAFREHNRTETTRLERERNSKEHVAIIKINAFKQPPEEITQKFKDWRSDVNALPDSANLEFIGEYQRLLKRLQEDNLPRHEKKFDEYLQETITNKIADFRMFFENWSDAIKENIKVLNDALREIDFKSSPKTYIQLVIPTKMSEDVKEFRSALYRAIPNVKEIESMEDGKRHHFEQHIEPLIHRLEKEEWRKKVMDVRGWFSYKAEEFYKETGQKFKTYENMGQLSGGEKAQLTYTILGSAIAYQFGLTKEGLQTNSFRFIAIDEAFKAQDEDKARYLITLCKQLHLQLLVVTPSDNIHIVENDISFVHFAERKNEKNSWLYDMPIEQFKQERKQFGAA
uniref:ATP-binding protein n=1 Tax=Pedobacter schmidteae TaxID=2201271 RepID=UPI000EB442FD|nr:SbcC/MukB-like Walker B domain-containing protein [Pedobacter schmidteae]